MKIDVILTPAEIATLPGRDLAASTAVVFDVLRATSTILAALANGAAGIRPVATLEEAWALRKEIPASLVGGERDGLKVEGFHFGNSPLEYTRKEVEGREIIHTTTNGTVALRAVAGAKCVLIGALLNLDALAAYLRAAMPEHLLLICAGSWSEFSLEDALAAGGLMARLPEAEATDPGTIVSLVHQRFGMEPYSCLRSSKNGRRLVNIGLGEDVAYCSRSSSSALVPEMRNGVILPPMKS
jgi:2-phosphosulfolactate phosphatase